MLNSLRRSLGVTKSRKQSDHNSVDYTDIKKYIENKLADDNNPNIFDLFTKYVIEHKGLDKALTPEIHKIQADILQKSLYYCMRERDNYSLDFMKKIILAKDKPLEQIKIVFQEATINEAFKNDLIEGFYRAVSLLSGQKRTLMDSLDI